MNIKHDVAGRPRFPAKSGVFLAVDMGALEGRSQWPIAGRTARHTPTPPQAILASRGALIDVSVTIRPRMPIYPGNPGVRIALAQSLERGDPANVARLDLGAHTGTHVDAPRHFLPDGAGAERLDLDAFVGPCVVADAMAARGAIDEAAVAALDLPVGADRVLLRTPNSRLWERDEFSPDFVGLDAGGAATLIERGARLVGIDYLSIGDPDAHRALLGHDVAVVEGLDLRAVAPGAYLLVCLPLRIEGADGAPARAVLWPLSR
jgi:arylformamidase